MKRGWMFGKIRVANWLEHIHEAHSWTRCAGPVKVPRVADMYLGGGRRRRSSQLDSYFLVVAVIACVWGYFKLAPRAGGTWETTAAQVMKKQPTVVIYHPASDRSVLHALPDVPLLLVAGKQHYDFSGLQRVLFYSDQKEPVELVDNLTRVVEIRDFAGKAMSVLDVADRSLVGDFADPTRVSVFREEPPGVAECERKAGLSDCARDGRVTLSYEQVGGHEVRCLRVEPSRDEPLTLVWRHRPHLAEGAKAGEPRLQRARVYVAWPDRVNESAKMSGEIRIDGRLFGALPTPRKGSFASTDLDVFSAETIDFSVFSNEPVCLDLEVDS